MKYAADETPAALFKAVNTLSEKWYQPYVSVHRNGAAQRIAVGTWTKVAFTHVESDPTSLWEASNSRVRIKLPGRYEIDLGAHTPGIGITVGIYKNGMVYRQKEGETGAGLSCRVDCAAQDILEMWVRNDDSAIKNFYGASSKLWMTVDRTARGKE